MLSYQHIYHAGNLADVHKHRILAQLLAVLTTKDRPLTYIETHAGRGLYDLMAPEAKKTGEAKHGIEALLRDAPLPASHPYAQALAAIHERHGPTVYPGSPAIARHLLRKQDVLHLFELHPQEVQHLKRAMKGPSIHIHPRDGYEGALALCPPQPLRGLALIDPSFEVKSEYETVVEFMQKLHSIWPQACIALWYPMLKNGLYQPMLERLLAHEWPITHHATQWSTPEETRGMFGSGMVLVNAPYGFVES